MAIASTVCSTAPSLSTVSSLKTHQQCQSLYFNSSNLNQPSVSFVSDEYVPLAASADALAMERAVEQVASDSEQLAVYEIGIRRRKRRRRRKGFDSLEECKSRNDRDVYVGSFEPAVEHGFLSLDDETKICRCLKVTEMLDVAVTKVASTQLPDEVSMHLWNDKKFREAEALLLKRKQAKAKLTRCYRKLVASVAAGYLGKGLSFQDLIQAGSMGLLRGAQKFDPKRGCKLSTYVYWWIKQAIIKAVANNSRIIRLPGSMSGMVPKVARMKEMLTIQLRRKPCYDEVAEEMNLEISNAKIILDGCRCPISLDRGIPDKDGMTLQEILKGPDETTPEYMVQRQMMRQEVERILQSLAEREAHVLRLYFGLSGETTRSYEEIGRLLRLSRERVRQIVISGLAKLRRHSNLSEMKTYIV